MRQYFTNVNLLTVFDGNQRAHLEADRYCVFGTRNLDFFTLFVQQLNLWTQCFTCCATTTFRIDHAFFDVLEFHSTCVFGNDRTCQWIPCCQCGTSFDHHAIFNDQCCTVRYFMTFTLTAVVVSDQDFAGTGNHDLIAFTVRHITHRCCETDRTVGFCFNRRSNRCTRRRTTDVERTHCQLCTWLTDGLRSDNTDCFTSIDHRTATQITTVAHGAQTVTCVTCQWCTDFHFVDTQTFDFFNGRFIEQSTSFVQCFLCFWINDVVCSNATQDQFTQRDVNFTALNDRFHGRTVGCTAIIFNDNQILCNVNQTTCQVTRVCCFQRRICQTFTRTVGGNKVLQNVQTFAEVRCNWCFDNRTVWFRHQTTHTCQLTNLCCRTTRTGVSHHVNRVEGFLCADSTVTTCYSFYFQLFHHGLTDFITCFAPDIDHFIVTFTRSHQTGSVLLFDLFHFVFCCCQQSDFLWWY